MNGENDGKPYEQMDGLGGGIFPPIFGSTPHIDRDSRRKHSVLQACKVQGCSRSNNHWDIPWVLPPLSSNSDHQENYLHF